MNALKALLIDGVTSYRRSLLALDGFQWGGFWRERVEGTATWGERSDTATSWTQRVGGSRSWSERQDMPTPGHFWPTS